MANPSDAGEESLRRLRAQDPPSFLAPNPSLSETARAASRHLFSAIRPFSPKSPLDQLLVDGFDAEQIWHQIDLQSQPLLSSIRRRLLQFVKNPEEISHLKAPMGKKAEAKERKELDEESDGFDEELEDVDEEDEDEEEGAEDKKKGRDEGAEEDEEEEDEEEEGGESGDEGEEEEKNGDGGIEDKFLKIDEMAKYLEMEEENFENDGVDKEGEDEDDDDDDDEDEDAEFGFGDEDGEDEAAEDLENARYKDFFGAKKEKGSKGRAQLQRSEDSDDDMEFDKQKKGTASTYERQKEKNQAKIEQMEKANLEPKAWTMEGEVTAAKRPKNSALEVDLEFDHNVRPAPVITEEVTASIEDMIQKRIVEGNFDDVQRASKLPSKMPREVKELDDNKSKKGLADIYEQEYVEKKDPASAPLSFKDELKKEASALFKKVCLKADAFSHFSFAPKPVIEEMSFQTNVPALAIEEIAPVAVSDAAMLAPEEVFDGKGDIKEEVELTKEERKRRRANKKRKYNAEAVRTGKKTREGAIPSETNGKEQRNIL